MFESLITKMTEIIHPKNETFSTDSYQNTASPETRIAKDVAKEFVLTKVGRPMKGSVRKETEVVLRLSKEIELKHEMLLKSMCNRLNITADNAYKTFCEIADEIFGDECNWGRIVVLYTFAGKLAAYCKSSNMENMVDKIIVWLGNFVAKKHIWIKEKGRGWVSCPKVILDKQKNARAFLRTKSWLL